MRKDIYDDDFLGRAVFSNGQISRDGNKVRHRAFLERENNPISVDRFGFCSVKKLIHIQDKNAEIRSKKSNTNRSFYGWAKIKALLARKNNRTIQATSTPDNPYHADIRLPARIKRDDQITHAKELASYAQWTPKKL